ncbi:DUF1499 domain-containing protein [Motiliproteus sp.]|uniref:DUF1499 domain-containing protein n=1 Tax=Motiliproteus sp. TaxID=1898955 RepID=UPI003BABCBBB
MVKTLLILALLLLVMQSLSFFYKARQSQQAQLPGLIEGRLADCGTRPNCVSSEPGTDQDHRVEAFVIDEFFPTSAEEHVLRLTAQQIGSLGGKIVVQRPGYLGCEFRSSLYGFIDDVELRLDGENGLMHIRSGSRVGYSDLGANRRRVESLRRLLRQSK